MRIVAINGSHRGSKGLTQFLLSKVAAGARQAGAEFESVVLAEADINQCLGCQVCRSQKSYLRCVYEDKDDVLEIDCKYFCVNPLDGKITPDGGFYLWQNENDGGTDCRKAGYRNLSKPTIFRAQMT